MQYWNDNKQSYESAAEHFGYTFDHDWSTYIDSLADWMDENGISEAARERLEEAHILEYDYESCNWHITNEDVDIMAYMDDDDDQNAEDEDDELVVYYQDVMQEQLDIQATIDEKIKSIDDYYDMSFGHGIVSVYEAENLTSPDRAVAIGINWAALGTVSIEEAEAFVEILNLAIDQAKLAHCTNCSVTYEKAEVTYSPYGTIEDDEYEPEVPVVEETETEDAGYAVCFDLHAGLPIVDSSEDWHTAMECDFVRFEEDFGGTLEETKTMDAVMSFADEIDPETDDHMFGTFGDAQEFFASKALSTVAKIEALNDIIDETGIRLHKVTGHVVLVDNGTEDDIKRRGTIADASGIVTEWTIGRGSSWVTSWGLTNDDDEEVAWNKTMQEGDEEAVKELQGMFSRNLKARINNR